MRRVLALGAFFVAAAALSGCGGGGPAGNSVVSMAGNPITRQAFNHWMFVAAKSQAAQNPGAPVVVPNDPPDFNGCITQAKALIPTLAKTPPAQLKGECKQLFGQLSGQVLTFLIKAYWYQAEAHMYGIDVTPAQVMDAFNKAKNQQFKTPAQFQTFLSQTGQTMQDILFRFRINKIFQALLKRYTTPVSETQIDQYYQQHATQFGTPETRNIRIVLAKTQGQANAAKSALKSGKDWKSVAKQYSIDPTSKNNGGLLVGVSKGQEDAALDKAAFSAPINQLSGPIKGQFGYYVFEVSKITAAKQEPLAQARTLIRQTLLGQQQTAAQTKVDQVAAQHWQKKTTCRALYQVPQCGNYKAPPATSTATAPTPTPAPTAPPATSTPTPSTTPGG